MAEKIYTYRFTVNVEILAESDEDARMKALTSTRNWTEWTIDDYDAPSVPEVLELVSVEEFPEED